MLFLLVAAFAVAFLAYELWWKRKFYPPGPMPIPILGNILAFSAHEPGYDTFTIFAKEHGPIYTFWTGPLPLVVVTDYELMVEMFVKDAQTYSGRMHFYVNELLKGGPYGIVDSDGELWQSHRRFALHFLRDFGLGKNLMEKRVHDEVASLIDDLRLKSGQTFDLQNRLDGAVGSIINTLLFGYRFDESRMNEFIRIKKHMDRLLEYLGKPEVGMMIAYPFLGKTILRSYQNQMVSDMHILRAMFREQIEEHEKRIDFTNDDVDDFTEAYLKERNRRKADGSEEMFSYIQLESVCFDLWTAGMETTSNTLYWGVLYVLLNPETFTVLAYLGGDHRAAIQPLKKKIVRLVGLAATILNVHLSQLAENYGESNATNWSSNGYLRAEIIAREEWFEKSDQSHNFPFFSGGIVRTPQKDTIKVQHRLHAELNDVIGSDRLVTMDDKNELHYVNATIAETQRVANLLPLNLMHKTTRDVVVRGMPIKKGTAIVPQICAALYDEKAFPSPYRFDPTRHLDDKGHFVRIEQNIPFSLGKRACLGEGLARMELFLFLSNFFNQFKVEPVDPSNLPSDRKRFGATMKAINYEIILQNRH